MKPKDRLHRRLARFAENERGVAAVEFALILPLLLTLYLGSIEASSLFTVDRRVEVISTTLADLMARWNPNQGAIPTATLKDYFAAAEGILVPYPKDGLTQVVSFLRVTSAGVATVAWSCGNNGGTARNINSSYPLEEKMKKLVTESNTTSGFLVAAEVAYPHEPVLGMVFTEPLNLQNEALFLPRFGQTLAAPASGCPT